MTAPAERPVLLAQIGHGVYNHAIPRSVKESGNGKYVNKSQYEAAKAAPLP